MGETRKIFNWSTQMIQTQQRESLFALVQIFVCNPLFKWNEKQNRTKQQQQQQQKKKTTTKCY
jgi:hypothetical protein